MDHEEFLIEHQKIKKEYNERLKKLHDQYIEYVSPFDLEDVIEISDRKMYKRFVIFQRRIQTYANSDDIAFIVYDGWFLDKDGNCRKWGSIPLDTDNQKLATDQDYDPPKKKEREQKRMEKGAKRIMDNSSYGK